MLLWIVLAVVAWCVLTLPFALMMGGLLRAAPRRAHHGHPDFELAA